MGLLLWQVTLSLCVPFMAPAQTAEAVPGLVVPEGWKLERKGEDLILQPDDLPEGAVFYETIKPLKPLSDTPLREWLTARLHEEAATRGEMFQDGPIQSPEGTTLLMTTRGFQDASGARRMIGYLAFATPEGQARLVQITTTPNKEDYQPYMTTALKVVMGIAKSAGIVKPKTSAPREDTPKPDTPRPERKPATVFTTAPGAGIKSSQIMGVYMVLSYRMGVGGGMYPVYNPVLFLKDGTYCENTNVSPADLDIAASRRGEPEEWGRWKRVGDKFQMQDDKGKWGKLLSLQEAKPGSKGEALRGTFSNLSGGGNTAVGGGTMIAVSNSFTFSPDGSFKSGTSVGASSAEPQSPGSVTVSAKKSSEGTYTIDNYTLTLRYSNGQVERRFFAFMDAKEKDAIYINRSAYLNRK